MSQSNGADITGSSHVQCCVVIRFSDCRGTILKTSVVEVIGGTFPTSAAYDETVEKFSVVASNSSAVDDVPVRATWDRLKADPQSVLIDVRTRAEWTFVGVPDLSSLGRRPFLVEWQAFPDNRPNAAFVNELAEQLQAAGIDQNTELFFICRSGARSRNAAQAMMQAGWKHCHNVAEGFEGPLDGDRHRGTQSGWKLEGLPWVQG